MIGRPKQNLTIEELKLKRDKIKEQTKLRQIEYRKRIGTDVLNQKQREKRKLEKELIEKHEKEQENIPKPKKIYEDEKEKEQVLTKRKIFMLDEDFQNIKYNINIKPQWKEKYTENMDKKKLEEIRKVSNGDKALKDFQNYIVKNDIDIISKKLYEVFTKILNGKTMNEDDIEILNDESVIFDNNNIKKTIKLIATKEFKLNNVIGTFIKRINVLINILSRIDYLENFTNSYNIISNISSYAKQKNEDNNKLSLPSLDKNGKVKYFDFGNKDEKFSNLEKLENDKEKAMLAYYLLQPPRRRLDIQYLKLIKNTDDINSDEDNYLTIDESGKLKEFIYNNYKTFESYGQYRIKINSDLNKYFSNHINKSKIKINDYIFNDDGKIIDGENLSKMISDLMYESYGVYMSITDIRNNATTHILTKKNISRKDKEKFHFDMGHSPNMANYYFKNYT